MEDFADFLEEQTRQHIDFYELLLKLITDVLDILKESNENSQSIHYAKRPVQIRVLQQGTPRLVAAPRTTGGGLSDCVAFV